MTAPFLNGAILLLSLCGLIACGQKFKVQSGSFQTGASVAEYKALVNTQTQEKVVIITNMGGRVEDIQLVDPTTRKLRQVIATHNGNATAIMTNPHWQGEMLMPYANRIANATYVFNNTRYYLPMNEAARNNSIHGLLWNKRLEIQAESYSDDHASLILTYEFNNDDPGYPFHVNVSLNYTLSDRGFDYRLRAKNMQPAWPIPFFNSWHPYFNCDVAKARVLFDTCTPWVHVKVYNNSNQYSNLIPTGAVEPFTYFNGENPIGGTDADPTYYDDEFKALRECDTYTETIRNGATDIQLHHDNHYRFVQIFTGGRSLWGVNAIALEPMSAEADAFNNHNGLHIIDAGEVFESHFGVSLAAAKGV